MVEKEDLRVSFREFIECLDNLFNCTYALKENVFVGDILDDLELDKDDLYDIKNFIKTSKWRVSVLETELKMLEKILEGLNL